MRLENLPTRRKRTFKGKRVGRGYGSGVGGHTATRGSKGQKSRSGHKSMVMFEGGNVPFYRRMPKYRGFSRPEKIEYEVVNVSLLNDQYSSGDTVSIDTLREKGLIRKRTVNVKVLGSGSLDKKLTIDGLVLSQTAKDKVLASKGSIKESQK